MSRGITISHFLKVFFRLLVFLGFVGFLFVSAAQENGGRKMKSMGVKAMKHHHHHHHVEVMRIGREKHRALSKSHINYTSKRRVPNGPDPIHNRKAGNSRQPPGQA